MKRIRRFDRFRLDASTVVRNPNGSLDVWGVATTCEAVYPYPEHGTNEYRPADEVLHPDSLESLLGVPLTLDHPAADVDTTNWQQLAHGNVFRVEPRDNLVWTRIRFATDAALEAIKAGTVELSCGYDADYDETPGALPDGTPYTGVQRNIRYNHLALVDVARAGHVARIRLDSERRRHEDRSTTMKRIKIGKRYIDVAAFIAKAMADGATEHAELVRTDKKRADAIATVEVTIDGTTMVLPKAMVDAMLATIGAGGGDPAPAPTDGDPTLEEDPLQDNAAGGTVPPRRDTRASSRQLDTRVDARVDARIEAERTRATIERKAFPILGESHDYADGWAAAAEAIGKVVESRKDSAAAQVDAARKGDGRAQGKLLAWLDDAIEAHRDRRDSSGQLGVAIDSARRDSAAAGGTEPAKRTDKIEDARAGMRSRLHGKPKQPAAGAPAK